jgi:hypothetical protein
VHRPQENRLGLLHRKLLVLVAQEAAAAFVQYLCQGRTGDGDLGKPAQDKVVSISRATGALSFAANFILVATMKPRGSEGWANWTLSA